MSAWAIGGIYITFLFQNIIYYRNSLFYGIVIPALVLNITYFLVVESPDYVCIKNPRQAKINLLFIAKTNKSEFNTSLELYDQELIPSKNNVSILSLFKYKSLRITTIFGCLTFFAAQMIYYGINQSIS